MTPSTNPPPNNTSPYSKAPAVAAPTIPMPSYTTSPSRTTSSELKTAATQPFGYKVFYAAKKGVDWKPPETYREKMQHYILRHHPGWRSTSATRGADPIEIGLYEEFGQLFLKFSCEDEHDTIPFDLIEQY